MCDLCIEDHTSTEINGIWFHTECLKGAYNGDFTHENINIVCDHYIHIDFDQMVDIAMDYTWDRDEIKRYAMALGFGSLYELPRHFALLHSKPYNARQKEGMIRLMDYCLQTEMY